MRYIVLYTIAKRVLSALQCNLILQKQPVVELRYCLYEVVWSGRKCGKSRLSKTICRIDWLNGSVSSNAFCVVEPISLLTLPPPKGNYLSSKTDRRDGR